MPPQPRRRPPPPNQLVQQVLLDSYAPPSVLVDQRFQVLHFYGHTERYLAHPAGPPTRDLRSLVREAMRPALQSALQRALRERTPVSVTADPDGFHGSAAEVVIAVTPLDRRGAEGLLLVSFEESPRAADAAVQAKPPSVEYRMQDELRAAREDLESTIEELETSNEELKAANEEVTSVNEELQSTNEELETSKEELQSLNEELNTVNHQLQAKVEELEQTNNDLSNLLSSTDIAVLFLDARFRIRRYTPPMTRLLGLVPSDVDRPIADIRQRFTDDSFLADAGAVLATLLPIEKVVGSEDGRWYVRRILPYRTEDNRIAGVVVTFVDITRRKRAEDELRELNQDLEVRVLQRTRALQLLHDLTAISNEAETLEDALRHTLERVCRYLNWPVGHAWVPTERDPDVFVSSGLWYLNPPECCRPLVKATSRLEYRAGEGLVGRVLRDKEPHWEGDLSNAAGVLRKEAFRESDLHSAAVFPVLVRDRVVGILEFFDGTITEPVELLLEGMRQFGLQLGRVFERMKLQREIARISEEEQRRFSHELHDSIAQELTAIKLLAESLCHEAQHGQPVALDVMEQLVSQVTETQRQVRNLAEGLMPVELDGAGLVPALEALSERICQTAGIACRVEAPRAVHIASATAAMHLYHIAQEALHNVVKHAHPTEVVIRIAQTEETTDERPAITLSVSDNGSGFFPPTDRPGMGQRIMRYRANLIGAQLTTESDPSHGTTVTCRLENAGPGERPRPAR